MKIYHRGPVQQRTDRQKSVGRCQAGSLCMIGILKIGCEDGYYGTIKRTLKPFKYLSQKAKHY